MDERTARRDFAEFVQQNWSALMSIAVATSCSRSEAEDLVQTALTNAYVHWRRIGRDRALAYLRRSILNANVSRWRRARGVELIDEPPERVAGAATDGIDEREALLPVLRTLPPRQRAVLVLRYLCDLPDDDRRDARHLGRDGAQPGGARAGRVARELPRARRGDAMINDIEHRLRHELQGALVPPDPDRAGEMTTIAVQAAQLGARRPWVAPAVAAAAVLAAGGGIAVAATSGGSDPSSAPAGGSPSSTAPTSRTLPTWVNSTCVTVKIVGLRPGRTVTVAVPAVTDNVGDVMRTAAAQVHVLSGTGTVRLEVANCPPVSVRWVPVGTGHS